MVELLEEVEDYIVVLSGARVRLVATGRLERPLLKWLLLHLDLLALALFLPAAGPVVFVIGPLLPLEEHLLLLIFELVQAAD